MINFIQSFRWYRKIAVYAHVFPTSLAKAALRLNCMLRSRKNPRRLQLNLSAYSFIEIMKKSVSDRVKKIPKFENIISNEIDFCKIFTKAQYPIIAEIKFSSPSLGKIYPGNLSSVEIAKQYIESGASALSILTEPKYFKGDIQFIQDVRKAFPEIPILLKDFVGSKAQIDQGLFYGANAVLLIVAFLNTKTLKELYDYATSLGLTAIIEAHNQDELNTALSLNPQVIGINNRNLKTLDINIQNSESLINQVPSDVYVICESGLKTFSQIKHMKSIGFDGFLIGSHLMRHTEPGVVLKEILEDVSDAR